MRTFDQWLLALFACTLMGSASVRADAGALGADQRVKSLMRVLAYDRQLEARKDGGKIFIAVVFRPDAKDSAVEKDEVLAALGGLGAFKIKGLSVAYAALPYSDPASLATGLGSRRVAAIYVCGGLADALGGIQKLAARSKIATMSGSEPFTEKGLAFAVVQKGGKTQIVVNLAAAKAQGLDLDASLLGIATVLRSGSADSGSAGDVADASSGEGPIFQPTEAAAQRRISGSEPEYPQRARIQEWEATLTARVFISPKGAVERLEFVQTDKNFEASVKRAVAAWKFKPYVVKGEPVGTYTVMKLVFKLH
jgi:TonB family protein